jgi:hypothetical protein
LDEWSAYAVAAVCYENHVIITSEAGAGAVEAKAGDAVCD